MLNPHHHTLIVPAAFVKNNFWLKPAVIEIKNGVVHKLSSRIPKKKSENTFVFDDVHLIPSFVNAHCHLELTSLGPLKSKEYGQWIQTLARSKKTASTNQIKKGIQHGLRCLHESGVGMVFDHISTSTSPKLYFKNNQPLLAQKKRIISFAEIMGSTKEVAQQSYQAFLKNKKQATTPYHMTPHALYSVDPGFLKFIFKKNKGPFSIHLNESQAEQDFFKKGTGSISNYRQTLYPHLKDSPSPKAPSAIQYLDQLGLKLTNSLVIHANYLDEKDLTILSRWKNICVVHCPGSHAFFKHKTFPLKELQKRKIPVALGTDSICSNTELNYLNEIVLFLKKHPMDLCELMPMITTNAASAIGINNFGMINEGFVASFFPIATSLL